MTNPFRVMREQLQELRAIRRLLFRMCTPGAIRVNLVSERKSEDMDLLKYEAVLPVRPEGTDIVSQSVTVMADGLPVELVDETETVVTFEVPQGSVVELSMVYTDDQGNESQPSTQEFTAIDTIAPDAPGDFGAITLIGERTTEDDTPDEPIK